MPFRSLPRFALQLLRSDFPGKWLFQIAAKEIILPDIDVPSALLDYIANNSISNIVVGASSRNALTRSLPLQTPYLCFKSFSPMIAKKS